jgi:signal transduction histidine kinase
LTRSNEPAFERVNINDLLDDVLLLTRHRLTRQNIVLKMRLAEKLPALRADRVQIEQVCLNLILNAADAMPTGGTLTVATSWDAPTGILVTVADTGVGIPVEKQKELFQPFFTTRPKGTGLGLAIVQKIIEAHRGQITVVSTPGKGTTLKLLLPV